MRLSNSRSLQAYDTKYDDPVEMEYIRDSKGYAKHYADYSSPTSTESQLSWFSFFGHN